MNYVVSCCFKLRDGLLGVAGGRRRGKPGSEHCPNAVPTRGTGSDQGCSSSAPLGAVSASPPPPTHFPRFAKELHCTPQGAGGTQRSGTGLLLQHLQVQWRAAWSWQGKQRRYSLRSSQQECSRTPKEVVDRLTVSIHLKAIAEARGISEPQRTMSSGRQMAPFPAHRDGGNQSLLVENLSLVNLPFCLVTDSSLL